MKPLLLQNKCRVFMFIVFTAFCLASISCAMEPRKDSENHPGAEAEKQLSDDKNFSASSHKPIPSKECVRMAWEASSKLNLDKINKIIADCFSDYLEAAREQQKSLSGFPPRDEVEKYQSLNDIATLLFIRAELLMNLGQKEDAEIRFQEIIDEFSWAQAFDPSRGSYWSVAEKSRASIDVLTGKAQEELDSHQVESHRTLPVLGVPGKANIVDYSKFGTFMNVGTENYEYKITDMEGLIAATGEGIYPNSRDVYNNPRYKIVRKEGRLKNKHWDYVNTDDLEAAYFKWVTAPEPQGLRLFYLGLIFEKAEMYYEALKSYHALIVHFPKTVGYTYWQTPWYPAQAAIAKIKYIIRTHPELNLEYQDMKIQVKNGYDNNVENDIYMTNPGRILEREGNSARSLIGKMVDLGKPVKKVGNGTVRLVQYANHHWQLLVNDKPFIIKGLTYAPTRVGQTPDKGTLANWMDEDTNGNGLADGPYDSWVDANKNDRQDDDEPTVGDFQLLKEMGVNTLRIYHLPDVPNKELLRKMHKEYGFYVLMGDFLGKYSIGSGADWSTGTDYENEEHKKNMMDTVKDMVMEYKDEPYLLMWILGNENNYGVASNADKKPEAYFQFADQVAQMIKLLDSNHPVALVNGDTLYLDLWAKNCPNIDVFSANVYRGNYGFGSFWEQVSDASDKPAFITEYGSPAYAPQMTLAEAEQAQSDYHLGNWLDIQENMAGNARGMGNALGGVVFEWMDEWWKNYEPFLHDRKADTIGPFPGGYYFEEWFGLVGQGKGLRSPFLRQPRKVYDMYKKVWSQ